MRVALAAALLLAMARGCSACEADLAARYNSTLDCSHHKDICSYAPVLRRLASQCSSVVEMGVRGVVSSWALMLGLYESPAAPLGSKWMLSVDIAQVKFEEAIRMGQSCGMSVLFRQHDSATIDLPPAFDLLFIDTMHAYGHLRRELAAHASRTRRYIVFHDTVIDGVRSDIVRLWGESSVSRKAKRLGYTEEHVRAGLQPAIDEFLVAHPEWSVLEHYSAYPGLTVLTRHESITPGGAPFFAKPSRWQRWLGRWLVS